MLQIAGILLRSVPYALTAFKPEGVCASIRTPSSRRYKYQVQVFENPKHSSLLYDRKYRKHFL